MEGNVFRSTLAVSLAFAVVTLRADSPARELRQRLLEVGRSDSFYWAWTDAWLDRCGAKNGDRRHVDFVDGAFIGSFAIRRKGSSSSSSKQTAKES